MNDATFTAALVPYGLLPGDLKDQLEARKTPKDKATHFLDNAIKPSIIIGDDNSFTNLLNVMAGGDFPGVKNLAKRIKYSMTDNGEYTYNYVVCRSQTRLSHSKPQGPRDRCFNFLFRLDITVEHLRVSSELIN